MGELKRSSSPPQDPSRSAAASLIAWLLLGASLLILAGWQFRIPALKGAMFGTFVAPYTALMLILAVLSVKLQWSKMLAARRIGVLFGGMVALIAAVMVFENFFSVETGFSKWFFAHRLDDWWVAAPVGRVAMPTGLGMLVAGIALVGLRLPTRIPLAELAASGVAAIGYLALVGYLFGVRDLYGRVMAIPTAIFLMLLAPLIFLTSERRWLLSLVGSDQAGSLLWRRIGPTLALVIPAVGYVKLWAQQNHYLSLELGAALFVVVLVFAFTYILLNTAAELNEVDAQRSAAMETLLRSEKFAATGRLAATVAHEINNPLEAATNLVYLANSSGGVTADVQRLLEMADRELRRVAHITRQTLGFYRGKSTPESLDLQRVAEDVRELLARKIAAAGVAVTISGADVQAWADPNDVRQIISNLLSNAVDATASMPLKRVHISVAASGDGQVALKVADSGSGISPQALARLFEPFFSTKPAAGTGLGLYVTRQLVEKNQGTICLESDATQPELRTVATVTFPTAAENHAQEARAAS